jgi:hypothetical protein
MDFCIYLSNRHEGCVAQRAQGDLDSIQGGVASFGSEMTLACCGRGLFLELPMRQYSTNLLPDYGDHGCLDRQVVLFFTIIRVSIRPCSHPFSSSVPLYPEESA